MESTLMPIPYFVPIVLPGDTTTTSSLAQRVLLVQLESTICRTARSLVLLAWLESIVFLELVVAVVAVLENIPQLGRTSAPLAVLGM